MPSPLLLTLLSSLSLASAASYTVAETYDSTNFFTAFDFFTGDDPTHGVVAYKSKDDADSLGLTKIINDNQVYIGVDNSTTRGSNSSSSSAMPSVRLSSVKTYTKMLLVADVAHMPFSCGAWPALWTVAMPWPGNGEIDIIEGVNSQASNSMTLHTSDGCVMDQGTSSVSSKAFVTTSDCAAPEGSGKDGCQQATGDTANYGDGFNAADGGVYAMEWTDETISIWFFSRDSNSSAINADASDVDIKELGTPMVQFAGSGCDIGARFQGHSITIDTTFCGDWAGSSGTWDADTTCKAKADTCDDWMNKATAQDFDEVYWLFNYIKVYKAT